MTKAEGRKSEPRWVWHPWRLLPRLLVLVVVSLIWATRADVLLANHWAYPLLLTIVGLIALVLVVRELPRWTDQ